MENLWTYALEYVRRNDLSDGYASQLKSTANALSQVLNRDAVVADLTIKNINLVVRNPRIGKTTRNNRRRMLLTLAADCARSGKIERIDPFYIDRVKKVKRIPSGFSWNEAKTILNTVIEPDGELSDWLACRYRIGIARRDWWVAVLLILWDTGMSGGDVFRLKASEMDMTGRITRLRNKTSKLIRVQLSDAALHAVYKINPSKRGLVVPRWCNCVNRKCISQEFRTIADSSGVGGFLKHFRSGAGSEVERHNPGRGHEFLSNNRRTFEDHYWDQRESTAPVLQPPALLNDTG